jgi:putative ATPase
MRPSNLAEFVGQENIMGNSTLLRALLEKGDITSMILWGPPGCGKVSDNPFFKTLQLEF